MARKVAESHSVAYLSPSSAEMFGVEEGYWVIEDKTTEMSTHVDHNGEEYSVRHETNPTPVRRVFPAPDGGDGFFYEDGEDGDDD